MGMNKDSVTAILSNLEWTGPTPAGATGSDLISAGIITKVTACDGFVNLFLGPAATALDEPRLANLKKLIDTTLKAEGKRTGDLVVEVSFEIAKGAAPQRIALPQAGSSQQPAKPPQSQPAGSQASAPVLPGVKHVIAVGAGKGGVGKSTVAVNLAVGLALRGHAVGLMDGDIYGPSLPTMLGLGGLQTNILGNMLQPFLVHGVKAMTIGKLVDSEKPLIWRGPMAHGAFKQLVEQTQWGELDYLIIDLPPGTGDVALTMAQLIRLSGAVVVCTPQRVAQDDAVRALRMFQQLNIEVLGVVENMSYFIADDVAPHREYDLFGRGGAEMMAQRLGVPFLGSIPITMALRKNSDDGNPSANWQGQTPLVRSLDAMVKNVEGQVALSSFKTGSGSSGPVLTIS
jgi:ATP-binding protein involved in chromosome partitioning